MKAEIDLMEIALDVERIGKLSIKCTKQVVKLLANCLLLNPLNSTFGW